MAKPPTKKPISVVTARTRDKTLRRVQRHVLLAAAYERGLASDIEKVLRRIVRSAAKHVADGAPEQATKVVASYQAGLTRTFEGRLETVAMASAKLVFEELSTEKGGQAGFETKFISLFEIAQAAVRSWLVSYAAAKVTQILENTRTQIRKAIVRGNDQNEPPRVLARRIKDETGGLIAKRRAETIARTETHTAANVGSDAAADATGLTLEKEWCSTEDARVRPTHHEANGQRVDKEMDFNVGGERMRFPGDPRGSAGNIINCRCVVLWHPKIPVAAIKPVMPMPVIARPFDAKPKAERALHEKFFKDAPDSLKQAIQKTIDTTAVKNRKGARSNWNNGVITMNSAYPDGEYGAVWRHEFGHHIDITRKVVSSAATKEMANDKNQIIATVKAALPSRTDVDAKIANHIVELDSLTGLEQKAALTALLKNDMLTAEMLEAYGRPLTSVAGKIHALRLHYYEQAQDWHRYLRSVYDAPIDAEVKALALMTNDYIEATTKSAIAFGHGSKYYDKSTMLSDGVKRAQVLEAFANHIAITGSRAELASIFNKIVQRIAPQTWAKMKEIVDGLV